MNCSNCGVKNPDGAKFCLNCGTELQPAAPTISERKLVTILFADVVGSTAMAEGLDPEDVSEIMNGAFAFLNAAVDRNQGTVGRLMGDAILAFFGAPKAREDDPARAVRAALEMQASAADYAGQVERRYGHDFQIRVGINTGLALMDVVGDQVRSEYTAMGDAINLASRLEQAASGGEILISHDTYRQIQGLFDVEVLDPIQVKGKFERVQIYRVVEERRRGFHVTTRGVPDIETRMIGRAEEIGRLRTLAESAAAGGTGHTVLVKVLGEAGVGKSRLLREFMRWVDVRPEGAQLFLGRAAEDKARVPFYLVKDLISSAFDIRDDDGREVARNKLRLGLEGIVGPVEAEWLAYVSYLLGWGSEQDEYIVGIRDDSQQIRDRAFAILTSVFGKIAREGLLLLLLDDLHWADQGSLDLVAHLLRELNERPLIVICLARPRFEREQPGWGESAGWIERIELASLSGDEAEELLDELLRKLPRIPESLRALVLERAEGNPFYVEEVVKMLIEEGTIQTGDERWSVTDGDLTDVDVPPTLVGVLQARLDRLPGTERLLLQRASVIGRKFWQDAVLALHEEGEPRVEIREVDLSTRLHELAHRELVFPSEPSSFLDTREFAFKHAVLRDVTYKGVLRRMRRVYHAQVASWLEVRGGDEEGTHAGWIGEHHALAGNGSEAAAWFARAGKQAQGAYVRESAMEYYRRALGLWAQEADPPIDERLDALHGLGQVLMWAGDYEGSIRTFQQMRDLAEASAALKSQSIAWHGISEAQMHSGELRAAIESADEQAQIARAAGYELALAKAIWMKAWGALRLGEISKAEDWAEEMAELTDTLADEGQKAHSLNLRGVLRSAKGDYESSAHMFEQALEIFRRMGNRRRAMPLLNNLGVIAESQGDYGLAARQYQMALETAREIASRDGEMVYLSNLGAVHVRMGEYSEAAAELDRAIQLSTDGGSDMLSFSLSHRARVYLALGEPSAALEHGIRALENGRGLESPEDIGLAWRVLGEVAAQGRESIRVPNPAGEARVRMSARDCFAESERVLADVGLEEARARTLRAWAKYELESGDAQRGEVMWREAKELFLKLGAESELERMAERPGVGV
jgi:predicted ATPase/class 3 adenylate cyclase